MTRAIVAARSATHSPGGVWRLVEYNLFAVRGYWRTFLIVGLVTPVAFVLALGVGLGQLVDSGGADELGVPYLSFVAPAFLCAAALQIATNDAAFPVMAGFKWVRFFHGMAATPLTPNDIADGTLVWITLRQVVNSVVFLGVIAVFGGVERPAVLLAVPAAVLTAVAFAAPVTALAATVSSEGQAFNVLFRFVVIPMFLFSGTFYPISRLPLWVQWLAHVSPLWHGVELCRGAAIGGLDALPALGHVAYLLAWLVAGICLARWRFRVRIEK